MPPHGHITSLSVLRTHRKCGLATKLMTSSHQRMVEAFDAHLLLDRGRGNTRLEHGGEASRRLGRGFRRLDGAPHLHVHVRHLQHARGWGQAQR